MNTLTTPQNVWAAMDAWSYRSYQIARKENISHETCVNAGLAVTEAMRLRYELANLPVDNDAEMEDI